MRNILWTKKLDMPKVKRESLVLGLLAKISPLVHYSIWQGFRRKKQLGSFQSISPSKHIWMKRSNRDILSIIKHSLVKVDVVQCPLNRVRVRHKRRSRHNAMELRIVYVHVERLVMRNREKIIIVKNSINFGPVHIWGVIHIPTGVSENTSIGIFDFLFLKSRFRSGIFGRSRYLLLLNFSNHV